MALSGGFAPRPDLNLSFHGGRTIPTLSYFSFFLGGTAAWADSDVSNINSALANAMTDPDLNNVLQQYFPDDGVSATPLGARILTGAPPHAFNKSDVESAVAQFGSDGTLLDVAQDVDLSSTIFNFILPHGTLLFSDQAPSGNSLAGADNSHDDARMRSAAAQDPQPGDGALRDEEDSLHGLGGYHGSVRVTGPDGTEAFAYYAVGVYSEFLTMQRPNGIPVFDQSWKDVVATFYHELCEARTNPDVEEVNRSGNDALLGWYSDHNGEIGDLPMELAGARLKLVMKEVPLSSAQGTVPIQLQWSNAVGGPEGPISSPHDA